MMNDVINPKKKGARRKRKVRWIERQDNPLSSIEHFPPSVKDRPIVNTASCSHRLMQSLFEIGDSCDDVHATYELCEQTKFGALCNLYWGSEICTSRR